MPKSSARRVSYDLRPAKQTERRMILAYIEACREAGLNVSDYPYIGLGGFKFYDFMLMHKYAGIRTMKSIEHDERIIERCRFNNPFKNIEVFKNSVFDFIRSQETLGEAIFWFDYDSSLNQDVLEDIRIFGARAAVNSIFFLTVRASPDGVFNNENSDQSRLEQWKEIFVEFASGVEVSDVENARFYIAVLKVMVAALKHSFATREDGVLRLLVKVKYADGLPMLTVGGHFAEEGIIDRIERTVYEKMSFLDVSENEAFVITDFNFTNKERILMDLAATTQCSGECDEAKTLDSIGISEDIVQRYKELMRFIPRYVETYL